MAQPNRSLRKIQTYNKVPKVKNSTAWSANTLLLAQPPRKPTGECPWFKRPARAKDGAKNMSGGIVGCAPLRWTLTVGGCGQFGCMGLRANLL
jgi:hypothetical protein